MLSNKKAKTASKKAQEKRQAKINCDISRVKYCVNKLNEYMNTTCAQKINVNDLFGVFLGEEAQLVFVEDETGKQILKLDNFKAYEISN